VVCQTWMYMCILLKCKIYNGKTVPTKISKRFIKKKEKKRKGNNFSGVYTCKYILYIWKSVHIFFALQMLPKFVTIYQIVYYPCAMFTFQRKLMCYNYVQLYLDISNYNWQTWRFRNRSEVDHLEKFTKDCVVVKL
jgi:hypothetical protein